MNASDRLRQELKAVRNRMITALRDRRPDAVEEAATSYIGMAQAFLDELRRLRGAVSEPTLRTTQATWDSDWDETSWLRKDFRLFCSETSHTDDASRTTALNLPFHVAWLALQANDIKNFSSFIAFAQFLYGPAPDVKIGNVWRDLAKKNLSRTAEWFLRPRVRKLQAQDSDERSVIIDSVTVVLQTMNHIAKSALDRGSTENDVLVDIIKQAVLLPYATCGDFPASRAFSDSMASLRVALKRRLKEMLWGLAAYILDRIASGAKGDCYLADVWPKASSILTHLTLPELAAQLSNCLEEKTEQRWGWSWWEMNMDSNGKPVVGRIDYSSKLQRLFVCLALNRLGKHPQEALPYDEAYAGLLTENEVLEQLLTEVKEATSPWTRLCGDSSGNALKKLKEFITTLSDEKNRKHAEKMREACLDPNKVARFRNTIRSAYRNSVPVVALLKERGRLEQVDTLGENADTLAVRQLAPKEFFAQPPVHHIETEYYASGFGTSLAKEEDDIILKRLKARCAPHKGHLMTLLQERKCSGSLLILVSHEWAAALARMEGTGEFVRHHTDSGVDEPRPHPYGYFNLEGATVPVFMTHSTSLDREAIVLDAQLLGQASVSQEGGGQGTSLGRIDIEVHDLALDRTRREDILNARPRPEWLSEKGATEEERANYLKTKVLIAVERHIVYEPAPEKAGFLVALTDTDDEHTPNPADTVIDY